MNGRASEPAGPDDAVGNAAARRRAAELLLWYPRAWRDRYGEEFTELLVSDIAERPHAPGRTVDIVGNGLRARLADLGLAGFPLAVPCGDAAGVTAARGWRAAASLASLAAASAVFLVVGAAQWTGVAGCAVMTVFLALWGGYLWRVAPRAGRLSPLHVGLVNELSTAVLALCLVTGLQAARLALRTLRLARS